MKFYHFKSSVRRNIQQFGSQNVGITPIQRSEGPFSIGCMHYDQNSILGMHVAPCPQLLLIVGGSGWVRVEGGEKIAVDKGTAVFWSPGENHESGSDDGMMAFVVEGDNLDPEKYLNTLE